MHMSKSPSADIKAGAIYAAMWRVLFLSVNTYDIKPTAELLTMMTITLMDKAGYHPTVSDLVEITGLAQPRVTRYVSKQLKNDFLTEAIDPQDRRIHRLYPTEKAKREAEWHQEQTLEMARLSSNAFRSMGNSDDPVSSLKALFSDINGSLTDSS
jgi:DNA-binding MarR family transcriptional regulator